MVLSQYFHDYIVETLEMYGELSDVINKILDASDEGHFDIIDKPACESREGCNRYNIRIRNENYLTLLKRRGVKSKSISLRRLVYWFVDNEMYEQLGWQPIKDYISKDDQKINKTIDDILGKLNKLEYLTGKSFDAIREELNDEWRN